MYHAACPSLVDPASQIWWSVIAQLAVLASGRTTSRSGPTPNGASGPTVDRTGDDVSQSLAAALRFSAHVLDRDPEQLVSQVTGRLALGPRSMTPRHRVPGCASRP